MTLSRWWLGLALGATVVVSATGCLTPYIKRGVPLPTGPPAATLAAGWVVHVDGDQTIIDLAQNSGLGAFGTDVTAPLQSAIAAQGFALAFDRDRSGALNGLHFGSDATTSAVTGQWQHPDASFWTPDMVDSPFINCRDLVTKVRRDGDDTAYVAFVGLGIRDTGYLFKEPVVTVRVTVYDAAATKVLDLRGIGVGAMTIFLADRSPTNLRVAFDAAIASLDRVEPVSL